MAAADSQFTSYYYDKLIDITFYDEAGSVLATLKTPRSGRKPEIVVSGTMIAGNQIIQTNVVITNLEPEFNIPEVRWLECTLGYAQWKASGNRSLFLYVMYADPTALPPSKQITFVCTTGGQDPDIVFKQVVFSCKAGTKLSVIMATIKDLYNDAVDSSEASAVAEKLKLNTVRMNIDDVACSADIIVVGSSLWTLMRIVEEEFARTETVEGTTLRTRYNLFYLSTDGDALCANVTAAMSDYRNATEESFKLSYVVKAARVGEIYTITSLFDPRIRIGSKILIPQTALTTKRAGSGIIDASPDSEGFIEVYADVSISFVFSTYKENTMIIEKAIGASLRKKILT